ncbi:MAG: YdcF family protein [Rhizobiales bacterium]|nr:YdcF family protein [Hyphomicrobiales bacterium]
MFLISKLVEFLLLPSNLIGFIAGLGLLALLLRRPRLGRAALVIAALLLAISGWTPFGRAALMVLEDRFPQPKLAEPIAGIIMLGGAVDTHITAERGEPTLNEAGERITAVAELSRRFPQARLLLSGGANHVLTAQPVTESAVARDLLIGLGVDPQRIELEERSRTTCENAEQSLLVAKPNEGGRWVLVTSASHMARAMACFRAVGFSVIPYPVDYRTRGAADLRRPVDSIADGLQALDLAAHEWIGLVTYRLSGQTRALFPSP